MRVAVAVLSLGIALSAALPAYADYGAIAWDEKGGHAGWSIREPTPERASQAALSKCGASDCKVVKPISSKSCGAFAAVEGGKYVGAATRPSEDGARVAALAACRKQDKGNCVVKFSGCNK